MPKCEIFKAASDSSVSEIDEDNNQAKDRYKVGMRYHAVPPPYTGNHMPSRAGLSFAGLDDFRFMFKISETKTSVNENESIASKSSEEIREEPKTVRLSAPIIEDWESDLEDESVATKSEQVLVNAAKQNSAASTSIARPKHMTGNKSFLTEYQEIDGGFVAFGGSLKGDFKLLDESQVLLKVPRQNNMYSFDLKNVVSTGDLTCLFVKAKIDESNLWHRRLGHINFKTLNKLVRGNLVRGIENQLNHKVKIIRCDNGTKFKNSKMNQFCQMKGIKREFSVAKTPQQIKVAERKNRTLIEVARTMLADSLLPTTFWAKAVNTACYVHNRVLVTKTHNKTPFELLIGRSPNLELMRPFGCPVT
nr:ribonuclease H-like domain-containing protein [Tanacetum cinerariifolium]